MSEEYLQQLQGEAVAGIKQLCANALNKKEITSKQIEAGVDGQLEIVGVNDFQRLSAESANLLASVEQSIDADMGLLVGKVLKNVRLAAYTHIIGKDAAYIDSPLFAGQVLHQQSATNNSNDENE